MLPSVSTSLYFHRNDDLTTPEVNSQQQLESANQTSKYSTPIKLLLSHFKNAYTNAIVVKWSLWYAFALCGYLQIISYIQVLWKRIDEQPTVSYQSDDNANRKLILIFLI